MRRSLLLIFFAGLTLIGLALVCAGYILRQRHAFSGEMCVAEGHSERILLCRSAGGKSYSRLGATTVWKGVAPDAIPFADPQTTRQRLDPGYRYDIVQLPFCIRLNGVSILNQEEPLNTLKVTYPGHQETRAIALGDRFALDGEEVKVTAIGRWSGLLRNPAGVPLVAVSLRREGGPWTDNLFVAAGSWLHVGPNGGLHVAWCESQEAAREASAKGLPGIESARWGVADGGAMNWFQSFLPGTGVELSNGASVTLLELDAERAPNIAATPTIRVQIVKDTQAKTIQVTANEPAAEGLVRFDYPSLLDTVFLLFPWQDGHAVAAAYYRGEPCGTAALLAGESWAPEGGVWEVRLDQAVESALAIQPDDSTLWEAVLRTPLREIRLRQGEAVRVNDLLLQYSRFAPPPTVRYDLSVVEDGGEEQVFSLGPRDAVQIQGWRFTQGPLDPSAVHTALLRAERAPGPGLKFAGLAFVAIGLAGLAWRSRAAYVQIRA